MGASTDIAASNLYNKIAYPNNFDIIPDKVPGAPQQLRDVWEEGDAHEVTDQQQDGSDDQRIEEVASQVVPVHVQQRATLRLDR